MTATEPIRKQEHLRALADYFLKHRQYRDHAMLVLGVSTALRISDLLRLKWSEIYEDSCGEFLTHITLTEQKTGKQKTIALNPHAVKALKMLRPYRKNDWIFASRHGDAPITRQQAWRIIRDVCSAVGVNGKISCHSLRKTWGYHAWTSQSVSPVVIMDIFNRSSYDVTKRYLGVAQDDLDRAYLEMDLF